MLLNAFSSLQLQQILLSYIPNPQLELILVMLVVPFIVNVSDAMASTKWGGLEMGPFQWEECTGHGLAALSNQSGWKVKGSGSKDICYKHKSVSAAYQGLCS